MRKGYHNLFRKEIFDLVPVTATKILDIGCGTGLLGQAIQNRQKCKYDGIEIDEEAAATAKENIDNVYVHDLDCMDLPMNDKYDCIILADVLEHLKYPENLLHNLKDNYVYSNCVFIISLPNIRYFTVSIPLLIKGKWKYEDKGIMDRTHLRFFTKSTCLEMFDKVGLKPDYVFPNLRYQRRLFKYLDTLLFNQLNDLFAQQWLFILTLK